MDNESAATDAAAAAVDGTIYVIGGFKDSLTGSLPTVEAYDPVSNTWTPRAPMPTPRQGLAAVVIDGIIYAIGGLSNGIYVSTVDAYDPESNTWLPETPMPGPRSYAGAAVVSDVAYVVGGLTSGDGFSDKNEAFSRGSAVPGSAEQCRQGGWMVFGIFKNQGDCVSYVATQGRNQPAGSP